MQAAHFRAQAVNALVARLALLTTRLFRRRVPVVLQLNSVECAAACLAMVAAYHGRKIAIAECRSACEAGRDGVTARVLAQAGRSLGLRVRTYSAQLWGLPYLPLPAILHWNFNHYVVLERWSAGEAWIVDPAYGRRRVSAKEFDGAFTGIALALEPGIDFAARRTTPQRAWRAYLLDTLLRHSSVLVQIGIASIVLQAFGLALPFATQVLLDRVIPRHASGALAILAAGAAVVVVSQAITAALRATLLMYLQGRLDAALMLGFVERLLHLPYNFFATRTIGDLTLRLSSNAFIREVIAGQTVSIVLDGALVAGYFCVLLVRAPLLGLTALGIGSLQIGVLLLTQRAQARLAQRNLVTQSRSQSYLVEALGGIATLKATGSEDRALERWSDLFYADLDASLSRQRLTSISELLLGALQTAAALLLLVAGSARVLDGTLSAGSMIALNTIALGALMPLGALVTAVGRFRVAGAHLARIADVMEAQPERLGAASGPGVKSFDAPLRGRIELRDVGFAYARDATPVLSGIELTIEPGQHVALVGRSGSGKTTLAMLLLGMYEPTHGEVRYDDVPLAACNRRAVRQRCGVVLQEPVLFAGSIRENIAFSNPGMSLDAVRCAAQRAAIDAEIEAMPLGYETLVGERGSNLSGGQRQRIAIARALAAEPAIVVFDEATSHLDSISERHVASELERVKATRIVIAHRLSTLRDADVIIVLEDGRIVERGTHEELLLRDGTYTKLVRGQLVRDVTHGNDESITG